MGSRVPVVSREGTVVFLAEKQQVEGPKRWAHLGAMPTVEAVSRRRCWFSAARAATAVIAKGSGTTAASIPRSSLALHTGGQTDSGEG